MQCALYSKGKVESGVKYIKGNFIPGRHFVDIIDFQQQLDEWNACIADQRIHGTTHEAPNSRWAAEQAALLPIAGHRPFDHCVDVSRVVADDYLGQLPHQPILGAMAVDWQDGAVDRRGRCAVDLPR